MVVKITQIMLTVFIVLFLIKLFYARRTEERIFYFNIVAIKSILLLSLLSHSMESPFILDITLSLAIVGFMIIVIFLRYLDGG